MGLDPLGNAMYRLTDGDISIGDVLDYGVQLPTRTVQMMSNWPMAAANLLGDAASDVVAPRTSGTYGSTSGEANWIQTTFGGKNEREGRGKIVPFEDGFRWIDPDTGEMKDLNAAQRRGLGAGQIEAQAKRYQDAEKKKTQAKLDEITRQVRGLKEREVGVAERESAARISQGDRRITIEGEQVRGTNEYNRGVLGLKKDELTEAQQERLARYQLLEKELGTKQDQIRINKVLALAGLEGQERDREMQMNMLNYRMSMDDYNRQQNLFMSLGQALGGLIGRR